MVDRQHSRFSTLNVFAKMSASRPPKPPPKDQFYLQSSVSAASLTPSLNPSIGRFASGYASSSRDTLNVPPQTPISAPSQVQHVHTARSRSPSQTSHYGQQGFLSPPSSASSVVSSEPTSSAFKKGFYKLSSLSKKSFARMPNTSKTFLPFSRSQVDVTSVQPDSIDDGAISFPFNVQVRVAEYYPFFGR